MKRRNDFRVYSRYGEEIMDFQRIERLLDETKITKAGRILEVLNNDKVIAATGNRRFIANNGI